MIPPLDLRAATDELREELEEVFGRFLDSGRYVLGAEVSTFESEYAAFCEADHCVGVSSGLDALHLALRAIGVGPGDEVIVASNTYIATWLAVTHTGATVIPVEPDPVTHNLDPSRIGQRLTAQTKAVLATNLYGLPIDYDRIRQITKAAGLWFLVDNAQANGAVYRGQPVGGLADLECHSFYPTKNLGALGEAGAVTTSDGALAERIQMLRNYGSRRRYHHELAGFNCRLDELQAGILRVKLRFIEEWNVRRRRIAELYREQLQTARNIILPVEPAWGRSAWHLYVVRVPERDRVCAAMEQQDVGCLVHYPTPPHRSEAYADCFRHAENLPIADALADSVLSLPMGPHLSAADARTVADKLRSTVDNITQTLNHENTRRQDAA